MDTPTRATTAGTPLGDDERAELTWLRSENRLLRVERDILLRVATGYATDAAQDVVARSRRPVDGPRQG